MQSLEAACDEGEPVVKGLKFLRSAAQPIASSRDESTDDKILRFDIFEELQKLCDEEENYSSDDEEGVQYKSLILEKLVKREKLNTVILNLYPGTEGYSLAFRMHDRKLDKMGLKDENLLYTATRGYDEDTLLRYVDQQEVPPLLIDAFEKFDFLFYNGCVIFEVRNYRAAYPKYSTHHVLLRPSQRTILADLNSIMQSRSDFTTDDRDALESQLVMAYAPELCLDPDPHLENKIAIIQNRAHLWNDRKFRKVVERSSQTVKNRKRKFDHLAHRFALLEMCRSKKTKLSITSECSTKVPSLEEPHLAPPSEPVVINEFRSLDRPEVTFDCTLYRIEDHILETEIQEIHRTRKYHITLSILYRSSSMDFWGELYLDRDFKPGERNGTFCRFYLGTRISAHRYVYQFMEIFTESGRKTNVSVRSVVHINEPHETVWPSNAFSGVSQRVPKPEEHMEKMNRAMKALSFHKTTSLQSLVEKVFKGDLESDLYAQTSLKTIQMTSQELEIDALATSLELSWQQYQAAEKAKRQAAAAAQQKLLPHSNIIRLLNTSPASNSNSTVSATVVNAINNANSVSNPRLLTRRMTLGNLAASGAKVLSHGNTISINNHNRINLQEMNAHLNNNPAQTITLTAANATRVNLRELNAQLVSGQPQTVTLTSMNNAAVAGYSYTMPIKTQMVQQQRIVSTSSHQDGSGESALGALLVGTPAADRPEIVSPNNTNSLLLEKLAASSGSGGQSPFSQSTKTSQYIVQSPKGNTVISPMSSPPPQTSNTLNVQSLNLTQLQNLSGLHNVQFQFAQPISLAVNVGSQVAEGSTSQGLVMSLPTQQQTNVGSGQGSSGESVQSVVMSTGSTMGTTQLAQLVNSGAVKNITTHHNVRTTSGSHTLQLTPGTHQFQLISHLQRPTRQQRQPNALAQASISGRTPITIKMAPNTNHSHPGFEANHPHCQPLRIQQKGLEDVIISKLRRSSNDQP